MEISFKPEVPYKTRPFVCSRDQMRKLTEAVQAEARHGISGMIVVTYDEYGNFYLRLRHQDKTIECRNSQPHG